MLAAAVGPIPGTVQANSICFWYGLSRSAIAASQFADHLLDVLHVVQGLPNQQPVMIPHAMAFQRFDDPRNLRCQPPVCQFSDFVALRLFSNNASSIA